MRKVFVINTLVRFFLVINTTAQPARAYRHSVVRDSGAKRDHRAVTVDVDQRLTVGQVATSIQAVCMGYGFAWLPEEHIREELQSGILRPLSLLEGGTREILSNWNLRHRSLASKQALMLQACAQCIA